MSAREIPTLYQLEPDGRLRLKFHRGQARAWMSLARFVWILAGTQGGKTSFGPWWLWREIRRMGPGDYFVATTSYGLYALKLLPELRTVYETLLKIGRFHRGQMEIRPECDPSQPFMDPPWARIILRSARVKEGVESATIKAAWLDECGMDYFKLHIYEGIVRRLSLYQGRLLGTTTIYNRGWLKTEVFDRWVAGDPTHDVIQFASSINPAFPREEYERVVASMPTWKVRMFYQGLFDNPPGLIFDCFDERFHVIDPVPIPQDWPVIVGIDPIGTYTAALWLAWDRDSRRLHCFKEYYEPYGKVTREKAREIMALSQSHRVVKFVGGGPSENQARLDWRAAGLPFDVPPTWSVESGIDSIYELLKSYSLVIHRNCPHLLSEMGTYSRHLDDSGQPTETIQDKDKFNAIDALRYGTVWLTHPGQVGQRIVYEPIRSL